MKILLLLKCVATLHCVFKYWVKPTAIQARQSHRK